MSADDADVPMPRVFLGLGANIGNREANLRLALRWLAPRCEVVAVSSLYRSEAVVLEGAAPGPDFLNAACEIATTLSPGEVLEALSFPVKSNLVHTPAVSATPTGCS